MSRARAGREGAASERGAAAALRLGAARRLAAAALVLAAFAGLAGPAAADTRAPVIVERPARLSAEPVATFAFVVDDPRATTHCRIDGEPKRRCTSPYRTRALADGVHRFTATSRGS